MARVWVAALAATLVIGSATAAVAEDLADCKNAKVLLKNRPGEGGVRMSSPG
jgi:hypothetical protein